jgi:(p)ppGpp synthase/HD superfamily hydrolase
MTRSVMYPSDASVSLRKTGVPEGKTLRVSLRDSATRLQDINPLEKTCVRRLSSHDDMAWAIPQYSREKVNQCARVLTDEEIHLETMEDVQRVDEAFTVVGNWRSSHSFPLNTFKIGLLRKANQVDEHSLVAQRLKRLSSITAKLRRFPEMKLTQMQDIAGCRAIVSSVKEVYDLVKLYKRSEIKHKLVHEDDYIQHPKPSGYRSVHLIYGYYGDKKITYNTLKVEMQLRSTLQHVGNRRRQQQKSNQQKSLHRRGKSTR